MPRKAPRDFIASPVSIRRCTALDTRRLVTTSVDDEDRGPGRVIDLSALTHSKITEHDRRRRECIYRETGVWAR